ncbi:type II toxin-antitoxin system HicB family antitoxin [Marivirga sp.]|uniref:type II toxin-antitoxin system HicB family antitoxin n=1 Tax=Marivirga sp. TaxID=2018662 RepID=UPI0025CF3113|nr:type II toxin-antitoxin system HicB family antitoxin [Marivirga sp.]
MQRTYRIVLNPDPDGGYTAIVPALAGCITWGKDIQEAKEMAKEAIELYIEDLISSGENVPDDNNSLELSLTVA